MNKILLIIPLNHSKLNEDVRFEINLFNLNKMHIEIVNLDNGPEYIENRFDESRTYAELSKIVVNAENKGFDGIYIDCFLDSSVVMLRELVNIPIVGGFLPSITVALNLSSKFSIITALASVVPIYNSAIRQNGVQDSLVSIRHVNMNICDMKDIQKLKEELFHQGVQAVDEGAESIILGCTGMHGVSKYIEKSLLEKFNKYIPVVNPTAAGLSTLDSLINLKLRHSQITYCKRKTAD
ncbi:MAG TPA: aspartate/glutamate racemase family protein [Victivallales bacterium]|nr:aspartate/glutamate racemase family protein [Victivallales bacterium]